MTRRLLSCLAPAMVGPARKFHTHEAVNQRNFRPPAGRSDSVAARPDGVGPTGTTPTVSGHTSGCEIFGLGRNDSAAGFQSVLWHRCGGVGQASDHWGNSSFDDTYLAEVEALPGRGQN